MFIMVEGAVELGLMRRVASFILMIINTAPVSAQVRRGMRFAAAGRKGAKKEQNQTRGVTFGLGCNWGQGAGSRQEAGRCEGDPGHYSAVRGS